MNDHRILGEVGTLQPLRASRGDVHLHGWSFETGVSSSPLVRLRAGEHTLEARTGLQRPDVAIHYRALGPPKDCGFDIRGRLNAGLHVAQVETLSVDGVWKAFKSLTIAVEAQPSAVLARTSPAERRQGLEPLPVAKRRPSFFNLRRSSAPLNVLIVLPGDLASNSALHVVALTRHLAAAGHRFVVVADDRFSAAAEPPPAALAALGDVSFATCSHTEALARTPVFPDGRGPDLLHAWTTRDNVRKLCEPVLAATGAPLIVQLEDNEAQILSNTLGRPIEELRNLTPAQADALLPWNLSHPGHAERFLARAAGATLITDRLKEFLPPGMPSLTFWPAADERHFFPRPRPDAFREMLGLHSSHTVLFYHGNVHAANAVEMRGLYESVAILNETGTPATLIRTGENHCPFPGSLAPRVADCVLELGRIKQHRLLPDLMALADFFVQPGGPDAFNDYRFPSKLPEFFSIGRPVILPRTNLGAAVTHGRDAYVLDRADAPGIAGAIRTLRADPELAARLARGATDFAETHFDWSRSAAHLEGFYRSVTDSAAR